MSDVCFLIQNIYILMKILTPTTDWLELLKLLELGHWMYATL